MKKSDTLNPAGQSWKMLAKEYRRQVNFLLKIAKLADCSLEWKMDKDGKITWSGPGKHRASSLSLVHFVGIVGVHRHRLQI
jgi:hypothetical protein